MKESRKSCWKKNVIRLRYLLLVSIINLAPMLFRDWNIATCALIISIDRKICFLANKFVKEYILNALVHHFDERQHCLNVKWTSTLSQNTYNSFYFVIIYWCTFIFQRMKSCFYSHKKKLLPSHIRILIHPLKEERKSPSRHSIRSITIT